mmetsp:Transcript_47276/g.147808  ORF Transcript_47276/g.147808 Transcript_47276/m.147808 type:complete len:101 (+) Transcript_47276:1462-1764(+)
MLSVHNGAEQGGTQSVGLIQIQTWGKELWPCSRDLIENERETFEPAETGMKQEERQFRTSAGHCQKSAALKEKQRPKGSDHMHNLIDLEEMLERDGRQGP